MTLQELAESKGLSLYQLAVKAEIGSATIYEVISGRRNSIRLDTAEKLAKALDVEIDVINSSILEAKYVNENENGN